MSLAVYSNHLQHLASTTSSYSGSAIRHGHGPILLSPTQPIEHHIMNLIILIKCTCHSVSIQLLSHKIGLHLAATVMPKILKSITEINNKLQHADIVKAGVKYSIRFLLDFFRNCSRLTQPNQPMVEPNPRPCLRAINTLFHTLRTMLHGH